MAFNFLGKVCISNGEKEGVARGTQVERIEEDGVGETITKGQRRRRYHLLKRAGIGLGAIKVEIPF